VFRQKPDLFRGQHAVVRKRDGELELCEAPSLLADAEVEIIVTVLASTCMWTCSFAEHMYSSRNLSDAVKGTDAVLGPGAPVVVVRAE